MEYVLGLVATIVVCGFAEYSVRQWDNQRLANTACVKPKIPPAPERPEYQFEIVKLTFPDGSLRWVVKQNYYPQLQADLDSTESWTPPMKELFMLLVRDWRNWDVCRKTPFLLKCNHKSLDIILDYSWDRPAATSWRCSLKISDKDTQRVVELAEVWKSAFYGHKLSRINKIKEIRNKRILLETQQKEAKMITDYLESK